MRKKVFNARRNCKTKARNCNDIADGTTTQDLNDHRIKDEHKEPKDEEQSPRSARKDSEKLRRAMQKVLDEIKSHKNAGPFLQPVDESYAPNYSLIIKEPMSILTMEDKLKVGRYKRRRDLERDFRLMVDNCLTYNGEGNDYTLMAEALWKGFVELSRKHLWGKDTPYWKGQRLYVSSRSTASDGSIKIVIKQSSPALRGTVDRVNQPNAQEDYVRLPIPRIHLERLNLAKNQKKNDKGETVYTVTSTTRRQPSPPQRRQPRGGKKKKKKPVGMKAIEALALAAEQALKDAASRSSFEDSPLSSQGCTPEYDSSAFPDLKISTTQSHPAALVERLFGTFKTTNSGSDKENDTVKTEVVENKKFFNDLKTLTVTTSQPSDDSDYGSSGDTTEIPVCRKRELCPASPPPQIKPCQVSLSRVNPDKVFRGLKHRIAESYFSSVGHNGYAPKVDKDTRTVTRYVNSKVPPRKRYSALVEQHTRLPEKVEPAGIYEYVTDSEDEGPTNALYAPPLNNHLLFPSPGMCHRDLAFSSPFIVDSRLLTPLNLDIKSNSFKPEDSWRLS